MGIYNEYLFQPPISVDEDYIEATTIYYNEDYNCFVDDYGNVYTLQEDENYSKPVEEYEGVKMNTFEKYSPFRLLGKATGALARNIDKGFSQGYADDADHGKKRKTPAVRGGLYKSGYDPDNTSSVRHIKESYGLSAFNEKAKLKKDKHKTDIEDNNDDNDSVGAYIGNNINNIAGNYRYNLGRIGAGLAGGVAGGLLLGPLGAYAGVHAGNMAYNKATGRPLGQLTNSRVDEYGNHTRIKESYNKYSFNEDDEYSSQSFGTGLGKAFDTGNKLWNININDYDQTFDSDFIGPGDEYSNITNLPALRAASVTDGKPYPGTIFNGINGKASNKPFRLKELRDDFGQNG